MRNRELILKLGVEGGDAAIFRTPDGSGGWLFYLSGGTIFLNEDNDDDWRSWERGPFPTLQDALASIGRDNLWVLFFPVSIHAEYRSLVWSLAQEVAGRLSGSRAEWWENGSHHWRRLCQVEEPPGQAEIHDQIERHVEAEPGLFDLPPNGE